MNTLKKSDWILIGSVWVVIQLILVSYLGINDQEESPKYITAAARWLQGDRNFSWNQLFYSGVIAIHVLLKWIGLPAKSMYFIQVILSGLSVYYFIRIVSLFKFSRIVLIGSGILYATCFFIQQWTTALFTDSIFCSLLVIGIYYLLSERISSRNTLLCWLMLIIIPLFRPVGFLFLLLAIIYWLCIDRKNNGVKSFIIFLYLLIIVVVIDLSLTNDPAYFYPNHNIEANVICGYPSGLLKYQRVPYKDGMTIFGYFANNPAMTIRLFIFRFQKIFSMTRDYFSPLHNILLTIVSSVYLILALVGFVSAWFRNRRLLVFLTCGILIFSIPSVIFCQDWSGRFSLPVFIFVLLLGSFGIARLNDFRRSSNPSPPVQYDANQS